MEMDGYEESIVVVCGTACQNRFKSARGTNLFVVLSTPQIYWDIHVGIGMSKKMYV